MASLAKDTFVDERVALGQRWTTNWHLMSIFIGVSHGVEDMLLAYSTSVLPPQLGLYGNAALFGTWIFSSMFVGPPVSVRLGARSTMAIGLCLQTVFYVLFIVTALLPVGGAAQWPVAIAGFVIGGVAAGFVWSSEGVLLAQTCAIVAEVQGKSIQQTSARMAAIFGGWNLVLETIIKLMTYGFEQAGTSVVVSFSVSLALAVLAVLCFCCITIPIAKFNETARPSACGELKEMIVTAVSPSIWLLSFTSLAFTVFATVISVINGAYVKPELGLQYVGLMSAVISFAGFAVQFPFSWVADAMKFGKALILVVASLVYMVMPVLAMTLELSAFGWGLSIFFIGHGVGRGVFRGVYYSLVADHFSEEDTEAAFGAVTMINAIGFTFAFILGANLQPSQRLQALSWITLILGALILPGYLCALNLVCRRASRRKCGESSESKS